MKIPFASLFLAATAALSFGNTPILMSYQGRVSDAAGVLIGSSAPVNRTMTFKFYSTSTGGTPVYAEAQTVTISAGEFSVLLGNGTGVSTFRGPSAPAVTPYITLPSIMNGNIYLGVTVDDGTAAADPEIAPRQQLVSAAYSFRAAVADSVVDGSLSTNMLADTSVTTNKIGSNQVTTVKIADSNITTAKIATGAITTDRIATGAITNDRIAANAVTTDKIADNTIATADIGNNQVTNAKIANESVNSVKIADSSILNEDIADGAISNGKIAAGSVDLNKLVDAVKQSLCPPGTIIAYAGDTAPAGWLMCNGAAVSRSGYADLYSVVGNRFGYGNNSSTFNVPDFRGRFLRGRDGNAARDPDRGSRTAMNPGGAAGDAVGSVQGHEFLFHSHDYQDIYHSEYNGTVTLPSNRGSGDTDGDNRGYEITRTSAARGGNETRPINANVNYIIKF
ncbi:tail fiber protein [Luteolibacter sp. SL250]|uniref:tail fiber protein n=1 Tax=Luteolibacter sp. SL250 TaxID=2995170 RepID=UPI002271B344|nr:tail fiber protein [Luteolibacter sp. SL250]WAC19109.1 tail fiber protein [Luteolibacter sp. SL250]